MKSETVILNDVPTKIITLGCGLDLKNAEFLVLVLTGNPGVITYYEEFMDKIYQELVEKSQNISMIGISQAGHEVDGVAGQFPQNFEYYDLKGQVKHKQDFFHKFIPKHIKIFLIAHSIGCYISLQLIKKFSSQIVKAFMLFPTIERMALTPNGKMLSPWISFYPILMASAWPLTLLPKFMKKFILNIQFFGKEVHECIWRASFELFNFSVFKRFTRMAICELQEVQELEEDAIEKYLDKLYFYFGTKDRWCPIEYAINMRNKFPSLQYHICEEGIDHAFVIENSAKIATFISNLIIPHL